MIPAPWIQPKLRGHPDVGIRTMKALALYFAIQASMSPKGPLYAMQFSRSANSGPLKNRPMCGSGDSP